MPSSGCFGLRVALSCPAASNLQWAPSGDTVLLESKSETAGTAAIVTDSQTSLLFAVPSFHALGWMSSSCCVLWAAERQVTSPGSAAAPRRHRDCRVNTVRE